MPVSIEQAKEKYQLQYKLLCYLLKISTWVNEFISTYGSSRKQKKILRGYTAGRDPDLMSKQLIKQTD